LAGNAWHHAGAGAPDPAALPAAFGVSHPGVEVRVRHGGGSIDMVAQVAAGRLDLALVGAPSAPAPVTLTAKPTPATSQAKSASGGLWCRSVIWRSLRNGEQNCPTRRSVLADLSWIKLRWTQWNTRGAVGTGISAHYTGSKIDMRSPISIRLTRARTCQGQPGCADVHPHRVDVQRRPCPKARGVVL
jgi:hypothetical protein